MTQIVRVVKVGGSLLDFEALLPLLQQWFASQPLASNILIAGGGDMVNAIRRFGDAHQIDDEDTHWASIKAMSINAELVATMISRRLIHSADELKGHLSNASRDIDEPANSPSLVSDFSQVPVVIFDVADWMATYGEQLPHNWDVTSDSIAAAIAVDYEADELVLLKSAEVDPSLPFEELSRRDLVDRYFSAIANDIPAVRFVNLRGPANDVLPFPR